ncbi:SpoIID/LytB domain-containing protein [Nocardia sp. NPDC052316]|uniref:SpoIID/LytB domain-containing protein n=1 Tax=Nocardia sp. NPDC052316 TaxID=3364329 RepID=UPI0037C7E3D8
MLVTGTAALAVGTVLVLWAWPGETPYRTMAGPGHGRGMSQHGALANAQEGWTAEAILGHYYPGATLGTVPANTVGIRLTAQDDSTLDIYSAAGLRVAGRMVQAGQAAHLTPLPNGGANVVVTVGCEGEVLWQAGTNDPWVYPLDPGPNRPVAEHLTLCGGTGYRGALGVTMENGAARTVNRVDVEDYLLGVLPAEVQANWADKGAAEALRAQAIAARSYVLAEHRYSYAQSCDTTDCQVYPGTVKEDPRTAAAVAASAGTVLLRDGRILRSEYSSAPDGGEPADIYTFEVGPALSDLAPNAPRIPVDPRTRAAVGESPIDIEYRRIGGASSAVGQPLGPEMALPENAGTYRMFTNGVIISTPTLGAQVVDFTTLLQLVPDPAAPAPTGPGVPPARESGVGIPPVDKPAPAGSSTPPVHESAPTGVVAPPVVEPTPAGASMPPVGGPASAGAASVGESAPVGAGVPPAIEPAPAGSSTPPVHISASGVVAPPLVEPALAGMSVPPAGEPAPAGVTPVDESARRASSVPSADESAPVAGVPPMVEPVPANASVPPVGQPVHAGVTPVDESAPAGSSVAPVQESAPVGVVEPAPAPLNVPTVREPRPAVVAPVDESAPTDVSAPPGRAPVLPSGSAPPARRSGVPGVSSTLATEFVPSWTNSPGATDAAASGVNAPLGSGRAVSGTSAPSRYESVASNANTRRERESAPFGTGGSRLSGSEPSNASALWIGESVPPGAHIAPVQEAVPPGVSAPSAHGPAPSDVVVAPLHESAPSNASVPPAFESAPSSSGVPPVSAQAGAASPPAASASPGRTLAPTTAATPTPRPTPGIPIPAGTATGADLEHTPKRTPMRSGPIAPESSETVVAEL